MKKNSPAVPAAQARILERRHLILGWIGLLVFMSLGIFLEVLHGLKLDLYLDVRNATRRLMWTLAHAHGTLFSLVNIAFALTLPRLSGVPMKTASRCFVGALAVFPLGFFLGGLWIYGGDPGPGILLVPVGAILLLYGTGLTLIALLNQSD